ncbi:hypothetical protein NHL50_06440 [Acidimicrobiia bacterium EGI L10123]|uniref:hypothetical protein n=1 Tax=Salinilacustrithrix flava TaxID=2957203 RepID=UPI003D7C278E|nr:hypothetical protein [Acidimicrobiia bacterium EGI L10123]
MLIWYVATALAGVWAVFDSPALDYRFVMVGAVLPVGEVVLGRPGPLHSLVTAVAVLALVMAATQGRRLLRRRLLGIPIGLLAHLVFSGSWADTDAFWWPLTGIGLSDAQPPELARGALSVLLELAGIGLGLWWVRRVGLDDRAARDEFRRTGRLPRAGTSPVQGTC